MWVTLALAPLVSSGCVSTADECWLSSYEVRPSATLTEPDEVAAYRGSCVVIDGSLEIRGGRIEHLRGLEGVVGISGDLVLASAALRKTEALQSLEFVQGDVRVAESASLEDIVMPALVSIGGNLGVARLPRLSNVDGLSALSEVVGDVSLSELDGLHGLVLPPLRTIGGHLRVDDNRQLQTLVEPDTLIEVGEQISVRRNQRLVSVEGFDALDRVTGGIHVTNNHVDRAFGVVYPDGEQGCAQRAKPGTAGGLRVAGNGPLEAVRGFGAIRALEGSSEYACSGSSSLSVSWNEHLAEVDVLQGLREREFGWVSVWMEHNNALRAVPAMDVRISLSLTDNPALTGLTELRGATITRLSLVDNPGLLSLEGLYVSGEWMHVQIVDDDALVSLDGLNFEVLNMVDFFEIDDNDALADISALESLQGSEVGWVGVIGNPVLSQAAASWTVGHVSPWGSTVAANAGWIPPAECPWLDNGRCDERARGNSRLCRVGTDVLDCEG